VLVHHRHAEVTGDDGVAIHTLLAGDLPLLVAGIAPSGRGPRLQAALRAAGLADLDRFLGVDLPRGAKVGFQVDAREVRLVDEREDVLLRAPRSGFDPGWCEAATRLKGTMMVALQGPAPGPELAPRRVAEVLDEQARAGVAIGAIVGVVAQRLGLPLLF